MDIGMFLIFLGLGLYSVKQYSKSNHQKYILFLMGCIYGIFNRNYMISINGTEINNTIYVEIFRYIILVPMTVLGYKLYKKKELF